MTQARLVRSPGTPGSGGSLKLKVWFAKWLNVEMQCVPINSGTTKVRNSGLGPDPDLSAKSGPE